MKGEYVDKREHITSKVSNSGCSSHTVGKCEKVENKKGEIGEYIVNGVRGSRGVKNQGSDKLPAVGLTTWTFLNPHLLPSVYYTNYTRGR